MAGLGNVVVAGNSNEDEGHKSNTNARADPADGTQGDRPGCLYRFKNDVLPHSEVLLSSINLSWNRFPRCLHKNITNCGHLLSFAFVRIFCHSVNP